MTEQEKNDRDRNDQNALARRYREAAKEDALQQLSGSGPCRGGEDPTLAVTHEVQGVPMRDVAHPDKADGEDHDAPPSPHGPAHDALMRGFEPGETSME